MSMLGEITHLQTLTDDLKALTMDPHKLPASSEQVRLFVCVSVGSNYLEQKKKKKLKICFLSR